MVNGGTADLFKTDDPNYKHFNNRMAKMAFLDIEILYNAIESVQTIQEWVEKSDEFMKRIRMFGESTDRLYVIKKFSEKEQKLKNQVN